MNNNDYKKYVVNKRVAQVKGLEADADVTRVARENRLRVLGFDEPTAERRKKNLALNVALCEWPKD